MDRPMCTNMETEQSIRLIIFVYLHDSKMDKTMATVKKATGGY